MEEVAELFQKQDELKIVTNELNGNVPMELLYLSQ